MYHASEASPSRTKLLFVDDDPSVTRAFALTMVHRPEFDVVVAHSAAEALALAEEARFPVVATDLFMPEADGLDLIRAWRVNEPDTVFVLVTGAPRIDLKLDAEVDAVITAIVPKPWDDDALVSVLCEARDLFHERCAPEAAEPVVVATTALIIEDDPADATLLRLQLGGFEPKLEVIDHRERLDASLELLRRQRYDIIFVDLALPDARGLDTVRHVRRAAPDGVVVVHSGHEDDALAAQALRLGAEDVWVKGAMDAREMRRSLTFCVERKRAARVLTRLAYHDPLTGLANRAAFDERIRHALTLARRRRHEVGVLYLDLDGFKAVNDTLGHEKGDELLQVLARRLTHAVRDCDTVARLGGDEFAILLEDAQSHPETPADRIIRAISQPILLGDTTASVSASVGIAVFPQHGHDAAGLVRAADAAMYRAKHAGKGRFSIAPSATAMLSA